MSPGQSINASKRLQTAIITDLVTHLVTHLVTDLITDPVPELRPPCLRLAPSAIRFYSARTPANSSVPMPVNKQPIATPGLRPLLGPASPSPPALPHPPSLVPSRRLPPHRTPKAPTRLETVSRTLLGIGQQINRFQRQQNSLLGQIAWLEPPPSPKIDWVQRQRPWRTRFEGRSCLFLRGKEKFYIKFCPSSGSFGLAS